MDDPLAKDLNDIADVEKHLPGYVSGIREWFRWYKTPDDKPLNGFGFDERALGKVRRDGTFAGLDANRWSCLNARRAVVLFFGALYGVLCCLGKSSTTAVPIPYYVQGSPSGCG